jgi:hypothetical protein
LVVRPSYKCLSVPVTSVMECWNNGILE